MDFIGEFHINKYGVYIIHALQNWFPKSEVFFHAVTEIANPYHAFSILFPLLSMFDQAIAIKILMTAMLSEWINALLKWLLMGHRPFWWVKEILEQVNPLSTPDLQQTSLTCETGPGNPSGHVMSYASILLVLIYCMLPYIKKIRSATQQTIIKSIIFVFYLISIILISISRLYVAAHFPHQCILGALVGIALGYLVEKTSDQWLKNWNTMKLMKATLIIWISAFGGYWIQRGVGVDPQWSVKLAFKWCKTPGNVHVSTTPIFALTRDCGTALGLAFAISATTVNKFKASKISEKIMAFSLQGICVLSVLWAVSLGWDKIPTHDVRIYYFCVMTLYAAIPVILLITVPKIINFVLTAYYGKNKKKKNK